MKHFPERLKSLDPAGESVLIMDGAMGTELIKRGLPPGAPPEIFNLENSDIVTKIHRQYFQSGAELGQTNTFGASPMRLARTSLAGKAREVNLRAAEILLSATPSGCYAAGNMGPSGEMLSPLGNVTEEELLESFSVQAGYFREAGIHIAVIETMMDLNEAILAVKAVVNEGLTTLAMMTFNKTARGYFTIMGNTPAECATALTDAGASAIGANCTLTPSDMIELATEFVKVSRVPVIIEPNAGQPTPTKTGIEYPSDPESFSSEMVKIKYAGATILGGCCGTTPEFIRVMKEKLG